MTDDPLAPARGCLTGIALGVAMWAVGVAALAVAIAQVVAR